MENNGFGTADILTGRGLGLGGFGYGGYGQGSYGTLSSLAHADGTAIAAKIDCNATSSAAALDRVSDQNEENRRILQSDRLNDKIDGNALESAILNGQRDVAMVDRLNKVSSDAALCCCETQKLILSENNATRELMAAQALKTAEREIDVLRGDSNTQKIIAAILASNGHGHGRGVAEVVQTAL